ncbi:hypothetical protein PGT21_008312 [Puccinia graminis f. sp. tritici]|uniref:Uncharacterized protein n=1 Tax=Puccinia graminis f. sp. tritici TaxID=56615 RepID=A0A5B0NY79_PUCGR|nr:hypothetical protein PGT21_008312 [Puccinia graminis f. sp. tritici]KAA1093702.1 hypothetical protein PGTUg99_021663 [Puccinia graminis f. sp. tritici]
MDDVRPWITKKIIEGPLKRLETESILDKQTASVLPLEPIRTQKIQFVRFHSPHRWGSQEPVWAEASDRDVVILVYLSPQIIQKFESDQKADKRSFGQLGFPTFSLGGCRWIWDAPPNTNRNGERIFKNQLCLKVVSDLPKKVFKFGSVINCPAPSFRSLKDSRSSRDLYTLNFALKENPQWNLLVKRLRVTHDPRLTASGLDATDGSRDLSSLVYVSIPLPSVSKPRGAQARRKARQSKPYSKPTELPSKSATTHGPMERRNEDITDSATDHPKRKRKLISTGPVSKTNVADISNVDSNQDTVMGQGASSVRSPDGAHAVKVAGKDLLRSEPNLSDRSEAGPENHNPKTADVSVRTEPLQHRSTSTDRIPEEQNDTVMLNVSLKTGPLEHQSNPGLSDNLENERRDTDVANDSSKVQLLGQPSNLRVSSGSANLANDGAVVMTGIAATPSINLRETSTSVTAENDERRTSDPSRGVSSRDYSSGEQPRSDAAAASSRQVTPTEARRENSKLQLLSSASAPLDQPGTFSIYFSSDDYPELGHSNISPGCSRPRSSKPFVLKIKGRRLSKYFL